MKPKKPTQGAKAPKSPAPKKAAGPSGKPRAAAKKAGKLPPWMPESLNTPEPPRGNKRGPKPAHAGPIPTRRRPHPTPLDGEVQLDPFAAREAERYAQPIASREAILQLLDRCDGPQTAEEIAIHLGLTEPDRADALGKRLGAMCR
ncbi:MAG: ribonuclease R, partial [Stenotrophomonas maltophilia]